MAAPEGDQTARQIEDRGRVLFLSFDRKGQVRRAHGQPGLDLGETAIGGLRRPGHGRARAVATQGLRPVGDGFRILKPVERHLGLGQTQFLALIDKDIAAQRQKQQQRKAGIGVAVLRRGPARDGARGVVVGKGPAWPSLAGLS